jgi:hypothetical protein
MAMAASDPNTRRLDEAERARHIAAGEATAFAITAGTMLLGVLGHAEAAQHSSEFDLQPPPATKPTPPPSHPTAPAPTELTPADHGAQHENQHAGPIEAPAADSAPAIHADGGAMIQAPDAAAAIDTAPASESAAAHAVLSIPVWNFDAPADHSLSLSQSTGAGAGVGGTVAPSSFDLGVSTHPFADTITGLIDTSLATVSHTIASLNATIGQLTSSLSGTLDHLTDSLTSTVANLTHDLPVAAAVEPLLTDFPGSTTTSDWSGTSQHGLSLFDTAGTVPTTLLHPLPLHLGFLGQPTLDGHETHDGAFSALGVHHF